MSPLVEYDGLRPHRCDKPSSIERRPISEGGVRFVPNLSTWDCPSCGRIWEMRGTWQPAGWGARRRHRAALLDQNRGA